ncbi:MAG: hypothetical protein ACREDR_31525, partial [Blastocatellia bacterium]
ANGVDFAVGRVFKAYTITGRVIDATNGEPIANCQLQITHKTAGGGTSSFYQSPEGGSDTDPSGAFRITGFLPGEFFIRPHFAGDPNLFGDAQTVEIKDQDISELDLKAQHGVTIAGSVAIEGDSPPGAFPPPAVSKVAAGWIEDGYGTQSKDGVVNSDGTFEIKGVRPGKVQIFIPFAARALQHLSLLRVEYTDGMGENKSALAENQMMHLVSDRKPTGLPEVVTPPSSAQVSNGQTDMLAPAPLTRTQDNAGDNPVRIQIYSGAGQPSLPSAAGPSLIAVAMQAKLDMGMMFPGVLSTASMQADHDLGSVQVVLEYNNAVIKGQVNIVGRKPGARIVTMVEAERSSAVGHSTSSTIVRQDGKFTLDGLKSGDYLIKIRVLIIDGTTGMQPIVSTKAVSLSNNGETTVTFDIDLNNK